MRLESALYASREGIKVHGQAISVVGDNIANTNTTGFKTSRIEFGDLVTQGFEAADSGSIIGGGNGVSVKSVRQVQDVGVIEPTGRALDVGIAGDGFFIVGDTDAQSYTRAGNFQINDEGLLSTADGQTVLGYTGTDTTLGTIDVANLDLTGNATTQIGIFGNLGATSEVTTAPTAPATFDEIAQLASFEANVTSYDSLGNSHNITVAYFKTDTNTWTAQAYINGADVGGTDDVPVQLGANATLTFSNQGVIEDANQAAAVITATPAYSGGAAAGSFTIDSGSFSQFANVSQLSSITTDGEGTGNIKSYEFGKDGSIFAVLDSGSNVLVGKIVLADFSNVDGLERIGNSLYVAGANVGTQVTDTPGTDGLGELEGGALERSTVDVATQFIDLVLYQRGYQANSQALNATNDLLKNTISLLR